MGQLPEERLKPSPAWNSTAIDLFGPFKIRDEVKKRTFGKAYGVILNCLSSRAVHIDIAPDYSTETFLMVFRRFVSLRGYPTQLYSDNGPQLVSANNELINITKNFNQEQLQTFGVVEGFQWKFTPADAPWQNGISEALIKTVKRALTLAIGENTLTFSELQTVCYEVANLVNERPIGRHPTSPEDGTYLSPNDLLLGRSSSRIPSGPFKEHLTLRQRFEFVQSIINRFFEKMDLRLFSKFDNSTEMAYCHEKCQSRRYRLSCRFQRGQRRMETRKSEWNLSRKGRTSEKSHIEIQEPETKGTNTTVQRSWICDYRPSSP